MNSSLIKKMVYSKYAPWALLALVTLVYYWFALQFEMFEGGSDNYIHYRVSRYAFKYPHLFLDHWGKPVFTLLSAPFAQFGFKGFLLFNVLCGVAACYLTYKMAVKLGLQHAWAAFVIAITMPIYFIMMASVMTEVLFSLVVIASVYLFLCGKYRWGAVLFSALFLIRTEGYIFYPVIIFVLAMHRQWIAVLLLGTFPLIYSVIGWFYFGDFLWLINQIPYGDTRELYGTGELLFFAKQYKFIFGKPTAILLVIGGLIAGIQFVTQLYKQRKIKEDVILIELLFLLYFSAHSYVWWSGTGGSVGLIRVMAGIAPLAAITAVRCLSFFSQHNPFPKIYATVVVTIISGYLVFIPFKMYPLPLKFGECEKTIEASVKWFQQSEFADAKIYFYEPLIYILLDRDPFDHSVIKELIDDRDYPEKVTKPGEFIFYDTKFAPNEGRLPLKKLMDNTHFKLVNYFEPLNEIKVLGGYSYAVLIFERVDHHAGNNHTILRNLKEGKTSVTLWKKIITSDKEITTEEFTPLLETNVGEMAGIQESQILRAEITYSFDEYDSVIDEMLVISIEKEGNTLVYLAQPLKMSGTNEVEKLTANAILSQKLSGDETIKIYIWSKSRHPGIIKSLNVYTVKKSY